MLKEFAIIAKVLDRYIHKNSTFIHGEANGDIVIYDSNISSDDIYKKMTDNERQALEKFGWIIDDGAFVFKSH